MTINLSRFVDEVICGQSWKYTGAILTLVLSASQLMPAREKALLSWLVGLVTAAHLACVSLTAIPKLRSTLIVSQMPKHSLEPLRKNT